MRLVLLELPLELVDLGPSDFLADALLLFVFSHFVSLGFLGLSNRLIIEFLETGLEDLHWDV